MALPLDTLSITDFLEDATFRRWMTQKHPEDRLYWQQWLASHPDKQEIYEQAVATFLVLEGKPTTLSNQEISAKTEQIISLMPDNKADEKPRFGWQWVSWAAAAAVIIMLGWWQFRQSDTQELAQNKTTRQEQIAEWKTISNTTQQAVVVLLPDNSSVLLSPKSQLRFRQQSTQALREVYLQGEGFFEVTKDAAKPFIVYTSNLTTKVLGTSFQIHSFRNETTAYVIVKTGKVTVTPIATPEKSVLLTMNERLNLETKTEKVVKYENKMSDEDPSDIVAQEFVFDYTPVTDIFSLLESNYHMPIQYERDLLKSCTFTGQLEGVPFLEKIHLICLTIESSYEVVDGKVVIHSKGCN
ncbi:MAG: FecR family protein [Spirosomataceae bacterium]